MEAVVIGGATGGVGSLNAVRSALGAFTQLATGVGASTTQYGINVAQGQAKLSAENAAAAVGMGAIGGGVATAVGVTMGRDPNGLQAIAIGVASKTGRDVLSQLAGNTGQQAPVDLQSDPLGGAGPAAGLTDASYGGQGAVDAGSPSGAGAASDTYGDGWSAEYGGGWSDEYGDGWSHGWSDDSSGGWSHGDGGGWSDGDEW